MSLFAALQERPARVLFVCLANSCRSQMAETFARHFGSDVIEPYSAGVVPAGRISNRTRSMMAECGVPLSPEQAPKAIRGMDLSQFDLIVNLSEYGIPQATTPVIRRTLADPIAVSDESFREVRAEVEKIVGYLVDHFRRARAWHAQLERAAVPKPATTRLEMANPEISKWWATRPQQAPSKYPVTVLPKAA